MATVKRVGIEIEGAFKKRFDDVEIIHDGSLTLPPEVKGWTPRGHLGEVITGAGGIPPEEVEGWIRAHYPDASNSTCGIHVHVSFDKNEEGFAKCSDPKFYSRFLAEMAEWGARAGIPAEHEFWKRLHGKNEYCKIAFIPATQARRVGKSGNPQLQVKQGGDRYCQLNFGYKQHGTIETRVLPTFGEMELTLSAVRKIVDLFDSWVRIPWPKEVGKLLITLKDAGKPVTKSAERRSLDEVQLLWAQRVQQKHGYNPMDSWENVTHNPSSLWPNF